MSGGNNLCENSGILDVSEHILEGVNQDGYGSCNPGSRKTRYYVSSSTCSETYFKCPHYSEIWTWDAFGSAPPPSLGTIFYNTRKDCINALTSTSKTGESLDQLIIDPESAPIGELVGTLYITSDKDGIHIHGNTPVGAPTPPFIRGIVCPENFRRAGIGMQETETGYQQIFTCVKISGSDEEVKVGTYMRIIYINPEEPESPVSSETLDVVRFPFVGSNCPDGFTRVRLGTRPEERGQKTYQVYTCEKDEEEEEDDDEEE